MSPAGEAILRSTNTASNPCNGEILVEYVGLTMNEVDMIDAPLFRFVMFWTPRRDMNRSLTVLDARSDSFRSEKL